MRAKRRPLIMMGYIFILTLMVIGCKTIDPAPFSAFSLSLEAIQQGSESQAQALVELESKRLREQLEGGRIKPYQLQLQFEGPFGVGYEKDAPVSANANLTFLSTLGGLNEALVAYSKSLVSLAGGSSDSTLLPSQEQFIQSAEQINAHWRSITGKDTTDPATPRPKSTGLLGATAIRLFETYLHSKQRDALAGAMKEVQPAIDDAASVGQAAARLMATRIKEEYTKQFGRLAKQTPANLQGIMDLNDRTRNDISALEKLFISYQRVPDAHAALQSTLKEQRNNTDLAALVDEAKRFNALVQKINGIDNDTKTKTSGNSDTE